jgi:hypothetical protein
MVMNNQMNNQSFMNNQNINNNVMMNNQNMNNNVMMNNQMGQMYPNMYNMPQMNYGYPQMPMVGYGGMNAYNPMNYIYQPSYNPGLLMNQPPLNNYNRSIFGNGVQNNMPVNNQSIKANHNINDLSRINNSRIDTDIKNKRAISSKPRADTSQISNNYMYGAPYGAYGNQPYDNYLYNGPSTNPDSFSRKRITTNNDGVYKPYTLKDYKEISSAKIVLGSLGPNIGTKEWEEKCEKMKKMEEYNSYLKKNKMVFKLKKDDPNDIIEKEKKEKIERSTRFKSHEYAKLVRPRSKIKLNDDPSYLPSIHNESQHKIIHDTSHMVGQHNLSNLNSRYETYQESDTKRRDLLKFQINEIKDSLLK